MGAAVFLRNIIGETKTAFVIGISPLESDFDLNIIVFTGQVDDFIMQGGFGLVDVSDKSL